jgi:hypothetical protein
MPASIVILSEAKNLCNLLAASEFSVAVRLCGERFLIRVNPRRSVATKFTSRAPPPLLHPCSTRN